MSTTVQPEAPTASPAPRAQCIRLVLEAEIWQDSDGGPDTLCVTTDELACEPIVPARLRGMVAEARAKLGQIERLAGEHEARDTLRAILAEHDAELEEWDTSTAPLMLRDTFMAAAHRENGQMTVAVPAGQDPIERVDAVVRALTDVIEQADQA